MTSSVQLPFGIVARAFPGGAALLQRSLLNSEFHDQDDIGSKSAAAALAFESVVLALLAAGYDLDTEAGHLALESAAATVADRL
jgi:hypothetical protein